MKTLITIFLSALLAACSGGGASGGGTQHIISYGQSLSVGERAVLAFPDNLGLPNDYEDVGLMFSDGVRSLGTLPLVPFLESNIKIGGSPMNVPTPGETPLYGVLKQLRSLPGKRIGSAPGVGGASIVDLSKGTEPYGRLLANVRNAMSQSESPYTVPAIIWLQGEADEYTGVPYASLLNKLANDLDVDIRAITKQKTPVQIHICLVQASAASQQQLVASQHPNVHIACENKDYEKSDGTHFSAKGSRDAGMALGASIAKMWQARL